MNSKATLFLLLSVVCATTTGLLTPQQAAIVTKNGGGSQQRVIATPQAPPAAASADAAGEIPRGGASKSVGGGTATIPNEVFNLVKSIVGAGVLSLPAGTEKPTPHLFFS